LFDGWLLGVLVIILDVLAIILNFLGILFVRLFCFLMGLFDDFLDDLFADFIYEWSN
jgi:hypothetical protein